MFYRIAKLPLIACAMLALMSATEATAKEKPNILLVMADDLGFTDIAPYGSEIQTPNLDRLVEKGILFTDFHASISCSPTRSMLLTGTDNHIAGLGNMGELLSENQKGQPGYEGHLNDGVVTLAEVLREEGYNTYMAGKWHLGHEAGLFPANRGFDRDFSLLFGGASHYSDMTGLMEHETPVKYTRDGELLDELPVGFYSSDAYADFLIDAIRHDREDDKPFLAYLAFTAPHDPMHVPRPWHEYYRGKYDEGYEVLHQKRVDGAIAQGIFPKGTKPAPVSEAVFDWETGTVEEGTTLEYKVKQARSMEIYAGMVSNLDHNYGRVVQYLEDIGELDNTIILFLSDNGPNPWFSWDYPANKDSLFLKTFDDSLGAMGTRDSAHAYGPGWASASSGPLNAFKLTTSEGGIRVPFIISVPGVDGGKTSHAFAYIWDIMPTLLELTGSKHPETFKEKDVAAMMGRSLLPLIEGEAEEVYGDDEFVGGELTNSKWMRQGPYKALLVPPPYGEGKWELFNLNEDPGESNDLGAKMPAKLDELIAAFDSYGQEVGIVPWEPSH